jgi:hypothetical protein
MEDMTTQVLIEIRDEARKTNEEVRHLGDEARKTNARLERLERRQVEAEVRIATEIVAVGGAIREMKEAFLEDRRFAERVSDHERRIQALESRNPG